MGVSQSARQVKCSQLLSYCLTKQTLGFNIKANNIFQRKKRMYIFNNSLYFLSFITLEKNFGFYHDIYFFFCLKSNTVCCVCKFEFKSHPPPKNWFLNSNLDLRHTISANCSLYNYHQMVMFYSTLLRLVFCLFYRMKNQKSTPFLALQSPQIFVILFILSICSCNF